MKKRVRSIHHDFGPVRLYLNDVRSVLNAMEELPNGPEIEIQTAEYTVSSIKELRELALGELEYLKLSCSAPDSPESYGERNVSLVIDSRSARLYGSDNGVVVRGVVSSIKQLVTPLRCKWRWVDEFAYFTTLLASAVGLLILGGMALHVPVLVYVGYGLIGLMVVGVVLRLVTRSQRESIVILAEEHELPSFWQRNRDQILLILISGGVGLVVGIISTLVVQKIASP